MHRAFLAQIDDYVWFYPVLTHFWPVDKTWFNKTAGRTGRALIHVDHEEPKIVHSRQSVPEKPG